MLKILISFQINKTTFRSLWQNITTVPCDYIDFIRETQNDVDVMPVQKMH